MLRFISSISLTFLLFISACTPNPDRLQERANEDDLEPTENGYCIIFYKLDDYAIVYSDNKQIFDTRDVGIKIKHDVLLDLKEYISPGTHEIKVEGYNAECTGCNQNRWGITYEIFKDGESLDYRSDDSDDQHADVGLQMTNIHSLTN